MYIIYMYFPNIGEDETWFDLEGQNFLKEQKKSLIPESRHCIECPLSE